MSERLRETSLPTHARIRAETTGNTQCCARLQLPCENLEEEPRGKTPKQDPKARPRGRAPRPDPGAKPRGKTPRQSPEARLRCKTPRQSHEAKPRGKGPEAKPREISTYHKQSAVVGYNTVHLE